MSELARERVGLLDADPLAEIFRQRRSAEALREPRPRAAGKARRRRALGIARWLLTADSEGVCLLLAAAIGLLLLARVAFSFLGW